jgi:hypothetical protein
VTNGALSAGTETHNINLSIPGRAVILLKYYKLMRKSKVFRSNSRESLTPYNRISIPN